MEFSINQIADMVGGEVEGNGEAKVSRLSKIEEAEEGSISFLANPKYESHVYTSKATALIVSHTFKPRKKITPNLIRVEDPYNSFTRLLEEYDKFITYQREGVEEPSFLGKGTEIGALVYRGAFSYIGDHVKIGKNVKIYPHVFIGDHCVIGDHTVLHSGVKVYPHCQIGSHCMIHSGAVIGSDGFGYAPQKDGSYKKIPQLGNVILHDFVDVGANTVIDCATMGSTQVHEGVKLDNLIQIAHNVEIGKHTAIASQAGISGSSKIGERVIIAGQAGVVGHLEIADKVTIAAQAGVTKSWLSEGQVILGAPAFDRKEFMKSYAIFRRLPDLSARLEELEKKILNLPTI